MSRWRCTFACSSSNRMILDEGEGCGHTWKKLKKSAPENLNFHDDESKRTIMSELSTTLSTHAAGIDLLNIGSWYVLSFLNGAGSSGIG